MRSGNRFSRRKLANWRSSPAILLAATVIFAGSAAALSFALETRPQLPRVHSYGSGDGSAVRTSTSSGTCNIKGNISMVTGERIYHVPGQVYYWTTRIDSLKGERWFCSEAEARQAGWRRSKL
jgi:hypothetical protein